MKKFVFLWCCLFASTVYAQDVKEDTRLSNIDWKEDTAEIVTISNIIKEQEAVTSRSTQNRHFRKVWQYRSFVNFSYNNTKLTPKENIPTGLTAAQGATLVPEFKSDWGVTFQVGRTYRLHKKPIANTATFGFDFIGIDLSVNHFKAEGGAKLYNSDTLFTVGTGTNRDSYYYTPWLLEKYEADYGMTMGPSLTLAPFNYIKKADGLHFLKFHLYYHIGYHASIVWMQNDDKLDINTEKSSTGFKTMENNLKMDWGHGLSHTFGINMSWKFIGIGYERRKQTFKYQSMSTGDFGDEKYKFDLTNNRVYLQIRFGK